MQCNSPDSIRLRKGYRVRKPGKLLATIDAINASSAQLSWAYLNGVIRDYNPDLIKKNISKNRLFLFLRLKLQTGTGIMKNLNYKYYMLPGILVILVTAIGFLLAGLEYGKGKGDRND